MKKIKILIVIMIIILIVALIIWITIFNLNKDKIDYSIFDEEGIVLYSYEYGGGEMTSKNVNYVRGIYIDINGDVYSYVIPPMEEIVSYFVNGDPFILYKRMYESDEINNEILKKYTIKKIDTLTKKELKTILYNADKVTDNYVPVEVKAPEIRTSSVYLQTVNDIKLLVSPEKINISDAATNIINEIKSNISSLRFYYPVLD